MSDAAASDDHRAFAGAPSGVVQDRADISGDCAADEGCDMSGYLMRHGDCCGLGDDDSIGECPQIEESVDWTSIDAHCCPLVG
ncbi:Uncharacterised protein [Mycobacteroides abscessus subsp. massiliense]|uniref:hypothetical protein n=1 Tax=Mycobacteroides abscessus TaxID=36809 RepID=UPI0009C4DFCA|nr:hypothetical protein [Mycobacteroides abscessus]SLB14325.1 Uncharacterised protein [Mycobacteroides abscessus subsp. massiliense]SLD03942.1 Uncharacterised protein [Mycobacteroides abscessus subsp. massiliense]